ncbi:hypothetical protein THMIRHAM_03110 [Thiomicrorhabdus immobilis]|uniref:RND efflux pump membrane fusion protein barrel-sandwich domain-containing protein n=1 Tax=Thiomicrorhabdus immobilis TaxID=2791037 RepID=A0ABN6CU93_9GAMM|nr:efflux RND transporter periplasmic adaptor subunit [Thiomicrorhabdus immobilis]BCN92526.1 hypothetical protein THMIRHAM_03110 [Thiomicrorhabdus immobilis]
MQTSSQTQAHSARSAAFAKTKAPFSKLVSALTVTLALSASLYLPKVQAETATIPDVTLNAEQMAALSIETQPVEQVASYPSRQYVAQSIVPHNQSYAVTMPIDGQIMELPHFHGSVQQGDVIALVQSPELLKLQSELIATLADLKAQMAALKRAKTLSQSGAVSSKQRQQLEASVQKLLQVKAQQKQNLLYIGMNPSSVEQLENTQKLQSAVFEIKAPVTGEMFDLQAQLGKRLMAQEIVISIAKINPIVIDVDVPVDDRNPLEEGKPVSLVGSEKVGEIAHISEFVDPMTQSIGVHTRFDNADSAIKPGQMFKVQFQFEKTAFKSQMGALTRIDNVPMVFVKQGDKIKAVEVVVLQTQNNQLYFLPRNAAELNAQSLVVVHGTSSLKNSLMAEGEE